MHLEKLYRVLVLANVLFFSSYSQAQTVVDLSINNIFQRLERVSFDYQLAVLETKILESQRESLLGVYDPTLNTQLGYQLDASDPVNAVFGTRNDTLSYTANVQKNFKYGTSVEFGFLGSSQSSNSPFVALDPAIDNQWYLKLRQSLWKNGLGGNIIREIKALENRTEGSKILSQRRKEMLLASILLSIVQLEYSNSEQLILSQAYQRALDLYDNTEKRRRLGVANKSDVMASSANTLTREQNLQQSDSQYSNACRELLYLLAYNLDQYQCKRNNSLDVKIWQYLEQSKPDAQHGELIKIEKDILAQQLIVETFKNRLKPDLNLILELASNGVNDDWAASFKESLSVSNPNFFAGIELSVPLGNKKNKNDLKREKIINDQLKLQLQRLQLMIEKDYLNAYQNYKGYKKQWELSLKQVDIEEKKLKEKDNDFKIGRAEIADVILYQQDVLSAQLNVKRNETQMHIAMINKALAEGSLLNLLKEAQNRNKQ
ncbi:MAG TPA: TolC family protein [Oligoflexia bacterium]|nr:TolC family protein [Oligoflexia bacterium]HMR23841.1 TolC family protein [Oligoflexia bacterium]